MRALTIVLTILISVSFTYRVEELSYIAWYGLMTFVIAYTLSLRFWDKPPVKGLESIELLKTRNGTYLVTVHKEVYGQSILFKRLIVKKGKLYGEIGLDTGNSHFILLS
jgi:hypothetical protein